MRRFVELAVVVAVVSGLNMAYLGCNKSGGRRSVLPVAEADSPELLQRMAGAEQIIGTHTLWIRALQADKAALEDRVAQLQARIIQQEIAPKLTEEQSLFLSFFTVHESLGPEELTILQLNDAALNIPHGAVVSCEVISAHVETIEVCGVDFRQ